MAKIIAQSVKKQTNTKKESNELAAEICYHYPVYKLHEARRLPYKDAMLLLKTAQKEQAKLLFSLTQIAAAPHTKKGEGVKSLSNHYKRIIKD